MPDKEPKGPSAAREPEFGIESFGVSRFGADQSAFPSRINRLSREW